MITDHPFRNLCGRDCEGCRSEKNNECSHNNEDFRQCYATRDEHAHVEEWSTYQAKN